MLTIEPERLALKPGSRVLDVGCGDGRHTRLTRHLPGITAVALDLGKGEVERTAASLRQLDEIDAADGGSVAGAGPWGVLRGSGYELPLAEASFDCVIISEVLEHLHRDDDAIRELSRVLKPGGVLALSVPREGPEAVCWALSREYRNSPGGHVRIYRRVALRRKLLEHGYDVFASHFAHALHSPYWWLKCAVGMNNDDFLPVKLYHRFLVWDLMSQPVLIRMAEKLLNPFLGKSVVLYATKG